MLSTKMLSISHLVTWGTVSISSPTQNSSYTSSTVSVPNANSFTDMSSPSLSSLGLTLNSHVGYFNITGTPNTSGTFSIIIKANGISNSPTKTFSFTINGISPIWATASSLPSVIIGNSYSQVVTATYAQSYTLSSGLLPTGLSLSSDGTISGTVTASPTAPTTASFTINAINGNASTPRAFSIVYGSLPIFTSATTLPSATPGVGYSADITMAYQSGYSITTPITPSGTNLSANQYGWWINIVGTPTVSTITQVTIGVTLTNSLGSAYQLTTIPIYGYPIFTLGSSLNAQYTTDSYGVKYATTANIPALTRSGDTVGNPKVDGFNVVTNDTVLVMNQINGQSNGIYKVNSDGTWTRPSPYNSTASVLGIKYGLSVYVQMGNVNASTTWMLSNTDAITIETTPLYFIQMTTNASIPYQTSYTTKAIATGNITLSGLQTIDGVPVLSGDSVLVSGQTGGNFNGVYTASTGNWTRTGDPYYSGATVYNELGSTYYGRVYNPTYNITSQNAPFCAAKVYTNSVYVSLTGLQTIDGVVLVVGDTVLATGQNDATQNGVWVVQTGSWTRLITPFTGMCVWVYAGSTYTNTFWYVSTTGLYPAINNTSTISFTQTQTVPKIIPVLVATTANISLSGTPTIDGISTVVGELVLVKTQTNAYDNGLYAVYSGTWQKIYNSTPLGALFYTKKGTTNKGILWNGSTDCQLTQVTNSGADIIVEVATTGNSSLSGPATIDGYSVTDGNKVLVKNQTNTLQNGVYTVSTTGSWSLYSDADATTRFAVRVKYGTTQSGTMWCSKPALNITKSTAGTAKYMSTVDISGTVIKYTSTDNISGIFVNAATTDDLLFNNALPTTTVAIATNGNKNLSGLQTINSYTLNDGDKILLFGQNTTTENGIWTAHSGAWTDRTDGGTNRIIVVQFIHNCK